MNIQQTTQTNSVQQFGAINAFRSNKNVTKPEEQQPVAETSSGVKTSNASVLMNEIDIDDIRECARSVGENDLTEEDIKYGLMYGRSVIAEWLC